MLQPRSKLHFLDSIFTLILLLAFLLFSLLLASTGSLIYQKGADSLNEAYTSHTALSYISEKIRQHDEKDSIFMTELEGCPSLAFREKQNDEEFITYIYYFDGALRELFTRASNNATPQMGSVIVTVPFCTIEETASLPGSTGILLSIRTADQNGVEQSILVHASSAN